MSFGPAQCGAQSHLVVSGRASSTDWQALVLGAPAASRAGGSGRAAGGTGGGRQGRVRCAGGPPLSHMRTRAAERHRAEPGLPPMGWSTARSLWKILRISCYTVCTESVTALPSLAALAPQRCSLHIAAPPLALLAPLLYCWPLLYCRPLPEVAPCMDGGTQAVVAAKGALMKLRAEEAELTRRLGDVSLGDEQGADPQMPCLRAPLPRRRSPVRPGQERERCCYPHLATAIS